MSGQNVKEGDHCCLGDSVPEPLGFIALAPECCSTLEALERRIGLRRDATRAPIQAPEWQGAASPPPSTQTQNPPDLSLLRAKNGLDNGVHLTHHYPTR